MSREGLEIPILGLLRKLDPEEVPLDDLVDQDTVNRVDELSATHWLRELIEHGDPRDRVERYWMARFLVDLDRRGDGHTQELLDQLAEKLLLPFEEAGEGSTSVRSLRNALRSLRPGEPISQDALGFLADAFHGVVEIRGEASEPQVLMSGSGAELASLLIELATGGSLHCNMSLHQEMVGGTPREVIKVEVDTCTNRSFADCKRSIDPTHWPDVNPFFQSVTILGSPTKVGTDWCGTIKEKVGPGINGQVYETDLDVTYLERPGMVVAAFDLAAVRTDPGKVTVDRGFLSCTDEGIHRRIRTLKVYRIENLSMPSSWICPLWSSQFALAAYWGGS
jgi:hypothetical protein